jgi:DNA gyrase/topoisomerase IV subunit A
MEGGSFWMKWHSMTTSSTFKALANFAKRAFLGHFQLRKRQLWKRINILSNLKIGCSNSSQKAQVIETSAEPKTRSVATMTVYEEQADRIIKTGGFRTEGTGKSEHKEKNRLKISRLLNLFKLSL